MAACWAWSRCTTTRAGFAELYGWLTDFGAVARVGVEGAGAYGAGLARFLRGRVISR